MPLPNDCLISHVKQNSTKLRSRPYKQRMYCKSLIWAVNFWCFSVQNQTQQGFLYLFFKEAIHLFGFYLFPYVISTKSLSKSLLSGKERKKFNLKTLIVELPEYLYIGMFARVSKITSLKKHIYHISLDSIARLYA